MTKASSTNAAAPIEPATVPNSGASSTSPEPAPELVLKFDAIDPPVDQAAV